MKATNKNSAGTIFDKSLASGCVFIALCGGQFVFRVSW